MGSMVNVMYVGNAKNWPDDTALKTKRVWPEYGSVVEVTQEEAPHYTQHPKVWRAVSAEEMEKMQKQAAEMQTALQEVEVKFAHLSSVQLEKILVQIQAEIAKRKTVEASAPIINEAAAQVASSEPVTLNPADPASAPALAERMGKIMHVIRNQMDKNDPADWSRTPRELPRVGRVTELCGFKVTIEEIGQAVELLKAA